MRLRSAWIIAFSCAACGGSSPTTEPPATETSAQPLPASVHGTRISSDCPGEEAALEFDDAGTVSISGDVIELGLSSMPVLRGSLASGRADIAGVATFWTTEEVTCSVAGVAQMRSNLVSAQVTETLSSASSLNCAQSWQLDLSY